MEPREQPPSKPCAMNCCQSFRVWQYAPTYEEDRKPWKCLAAFYFLTCALEYIADCQDKGLAVVFQSPTGCRTITCTDARVVYKAA